MLKLVSRYRSALAAPPSGAGGAPLGSLIGGTAGAAGRTSASLTAPLMSRSVMRRLASSASRRPSRAVMMRDTFGSRSSETSRPRSATWEALTSST